MLSKKHRWLGYLALALVIVGGLLLWWALGVI